MTNPLGERVVVIGAGQAGFETCAQLRALGHSGPIALVGAEAHRPYQRPPLSKAYLLGKVELDRLFFRPARYFEDERIDLHLSTTCTGIDRQARQLRLSDGATLGYEALLLATGARPIRLSEDIGGALSGVHYMRELADADALASRITPEARVLVVGGGYIGLEAAAVCAGLGLRVVVVEAAPRILQRVASAETSAYFRRLHRARGVELRERTQLTRLLGETGRLTGAELSDGSTISADIAIVGIGVRPNQELAQAAGLAVDDGIRVDARCRTGDPAIFAAGDCASFPHGDGHLRLESVGNAIDQAQVVARAIIGQEPTYDPRPWFWSDQFDTKLQIAGLSQGHDRVVARKGDGAAVSYWYYREGRLIAIDAMNDPRAYMVAKRMIESGSSPDPDSVADPATDLKGLLAAPAAT